ncbi:hypothetical protein KAOT1_11096 [Kordia algicida OT-1]|uniref:Uncharacterized protein n=2 Tax=Kordia TaxID=221065 RepID=A9E347_9FLAO|nr:hypothetical protein KAOT1_11096 [Kordia algicida OT-1]
MLFALQSYAQKDKKVFELKPNQSMCMTGKGAGQDAAINPYKDGNSIAFVKNLGENVFSIRVQYQGKIFQTRELEPGVATMIPLRQGSEMYFDSKLAAKVKLEFKDGTN